MLELRLNGDAKRMAAMRAAIRRECDRSSAGSGHAEQIAVVIEGLVQNDAPRSAPHRLGAGRRPGVFVVVTVQSDATMLMLRDTRRDGRELGYRRQHMLETHTSGWSTMVGPDGRTIWAEIARAPKTTDDPIPISAPVTVSVVTTTDVLVAPTRTLSRTIR